MFSIVGLLADWLAGLLAGWLADSLACWLVSRLACCLAMFPGLVAGESASPSYCKFPINVKVHPPNAMRNGPFFLKHHKTNLFWIFVSEK